MKIDEYKKNLVEMEQYFQQERGKEAALKKNIIEERTKLNLLQENAYNIILEKEILNKATDKAREKAKVLMEGIMTEALQMILNENKKVVIKIVVRDGVPAANLFIQTPFKTDVLESLPIDGSGFVRDVLSLSALICMRMLDDKNNKAPMFLDEPFKNASVEVAEKTAEFTKKIVEYLGGQFFMVTQERDYIPNIANRKFLVTKGLDEKSTVSIQK